MLPPTAALPSSVVAIIIIIIIASSALYSYGAFREAHTDSLAIDQASGKKPVSANQFDSYAELEEKNSPLLAGRAPSLSKKELLSSLTSEVKRFKNTGKGNLMKYGKIAEL